MIKLNFGELETIDIIYPHTRRNYYLLCWRVMQEKDRRLTKAIESLFN